MTGVKSIVPRTNYIQADASNQFVVPGHQYSVAKTQCGSQLLCGDIFKGIFEGRRMIERKSRAQTYLLKCTNNEL